MKILSTILATLAFSGFAMAQEEAPAEFSLFCSNVAVVSGSECNDAVFKGGDMCYTGDAIALSKAMRNDMKFSTKNIIVVDVWGLPANETHPDPAISVKFLDLDTVEPGKVARLNRFIIQDCKLNSES